jgi:hypothetical protein
MEHGGVTIWSFNVLGLSAMACHVSSFLGALIGFLGGEYGVNLGDRVT